MVTIERLDPESEADVAAGAELMTAIWRESIPGEPAIPPAEFRGDLRVHRPDIEKTAFLARDGEQAVGIATIDIRIGFGNEHMAWVEDLFVLPSHRRKDIGARLLEEVVGVARTADRTLVILGHDEANEAGAAFAKWAGGVPGHAERQSRLRLDELDRALMERWVAAAAERAGGYSLVAFDDRCPDDLLDELIRIKGAMNTAPRTEALDDFVHTAEERRAAEAEFVATGAHQWVLCARHDATGQLAGFTELKLNPDRPWFVEQGDTAVDPPHRERGLGRWLKAVNILRLVDERPEAQVVETWNDGTNAAMLSINEAMGFRPVAVWREVELTLE